MLSERTAVGLGVEAGLALSEAGLALVVVVAVLVERMWTVLAAAVALWFR